MSTSKIEMMRKALSDRALVCLAGQRFDYPGGVVQGEASLLAEMRMHGVIGENDGLTLLGSGLAGRVQAELLDALF